jgi:hypothetical protein
MTQLNNVMKAAFLSALKQRPSHTKVVLPTGVVNSDEVQRVMRALEANKLYPGGHHKNLHPSELRCRRVPCICYVTCIFEGRK